QYDTSAPIDSSPILNENGTIFIGNNSGDFFSIKSSGQLNWKTRVLGSIHSTPIIASNDQMFFGTEDGNFYEVASDTGVVNLISNQLDKIYSSPTIVDGSGIYFGTELNSLNKINRNVFVNKDLSWYKFRSSVQNPGFLTCKNPSTADILQSFEKFGPSFWAESSTGVLVSQDNEPLSGIISPIEFTNYRVSATFTSTFDDCDTMGVIAAATRDASGVLHTLIAVRQGCDFFGHFLGQTRWGFVLDIGERITGQYDGSEVLINDGAALVSNSIVGWVNNDVYVGIERKDNIITAITSEFNDPQNIDSTTEISVDLASDPRLNIFLNGSSFGLGAHSKPQAEFSNLVISTSGKCL
ncbi:hypothetical protein MJH12_12825, partial [bacterium]|nr:hypothetical protein [bacterium]